MIRRRDEFLFPSHVRDGNQNGILDREATVRHRVKGVSEPKKCHVYRKSNSLTVAVEKEGALSLPWQFSFAARVYGWSLGK